jgi:hypothetical protein
MQKKLIKSAKELEELIQNGTREYGHRSDNARKDFAKEVGIPKSYPFVLAWTYDGEYGYAEVVLVYPSDFSS